MNILTLEEVCCLLKITHQTGRNRLSLGLPMPPNFKVGRRRLFIAQTVDTWINEQAGIFDKPDEIKQSAMVNRVGRPRKSISRKLT